MGVVSRIGLALFATLLMTIWAMGGPDIVLEARLRHDAIRLEILPGGKLKIGDVVRFHVTSRIQGYLTLLEKDFSGEVTRLLPGAHCKKKEIAVRPDAPLTLPDKYYGCEFPVSEKGRGEFIVIVTRRNVPLSELAPQGGARLALQKPKQDIKVATPENIPKRRSRQLVKKTSPVKSPQAMTLAAQLDVLRSKAAASGDVAKRNWRIAISPYTID